MFSLLPCGLKHTPFFIVIILYLSEEKTLKCCSGALRWTVLTIIDIPSVGVIMLALLALLAIGPRFTAYRGDSVPYREVIFQDDVYL
jgi:hypothetical protein